MVIKKLFNIILVVFVLIFSSFNVIEAETENIIDLVNLLANTPDYIYQHNFPFESCIRSIKFVEKYEGDCLPFNIAEQGYVKGYFEYIDGVYYDLVICTDGNKVYAKSNCNNAFTKYTHLESLENLKLIDMSRVTSMKEMFSETSRSIDSNKTLNIDMSDIDVSSVTNIDSIFTMIGPSNDESFTLNLNCHGWNLNSLNGFGEYLIRMPSQSYGTYNFDFSDWVIGEKENSAPYLDGEYLRLNNAKSVTMDLSNWVFKAGLQRASGLFWDAFTNVDYVYVNLSNWDFSDVYYASYSFFDFAKNSLDSTLDLTGVNSNASLEAWAEEDFWRNVFKFSSPIPDGCSQKIIIPTRSGCQDNTTERFYFNTDTEESVDIYFTLDYGREFTLGNYLRYHLNGGSFSDGSSNHLAGEPQEIFNSINNNVFKDGYEFVGWYDNPELSGNPVTAPLDYNENHDLYAAYKEESIEIPKIEPVPPELPELDPNTMCVLDLHNLKGLINNSESILTYDSEEIEHIIFVENYNIGYGYEINLDVNNEGKVKGYFPIFPGCENTLYITANGNTIYAPEDCSNAFLKFYNLKNISNAHLLNTSYAKNFSNMFEDVGHHVKGDIFFNLSSWDVRNVREFKSFISAAGSYYAPVSNELDNDRYKFTMDLHGWKFFNLSNSRNLLAQGANFNDQSIKSDLYFDFSDFYFGEKTTGLISTLAMGYKTTATNVYLDVTNWRFPFVSVLDGIFTGTFRDSLSLNPIDLTGWDTSNVYRVSGLFENFYDIKSSGRTPLDLDISTWDLSNVTDIFGSFFETTGNISIPSYSGDIPNESRRLYGANRNIYYDFGKSSLINVDLSYLLDVDLKKGNCDGIIEHQESKIFDELDTSFLSLTPTRNGYEFMGWYEKIDGVDTLVESLDVPRSYRIFAKYKRISTPGGKDNHVVPNTSAY